MDTRDREDAIVGLFAETFAVSEGPEEGKLIGGVARDLLNKTAAADRYVFSAHDDGSLVGCAIFSRLSYSEDTRRVFILSPMAVRPDRQRKGVGIALIQFGLDKLRADGVDMAVTYGDPDYYARVGFLPISEDVAKAPLVLSFPHGWLAQSLTGDDISPLKGEAACVEALSRSDIW